MTKQEKIKRLRFAANCMDKVLEKYDFLSRTFYKGYDAEYSCNAVATACEDNAEGYINIFATNKHKDKIEIKKITNNNPPTKQTQLHRALMIDLYAEMLEKGDI